MVSVLYVDNEIEAELARGLLESEGLRAHVRFTARGGYPRYVVGYGGFGMRAPMSTYEVLVSEDQAEAARRVLASREPRADHAGTWRWTLVRIVAIVWLGPFLVALVVQAINAVRVLF